jgi:hypothetical protein
VRPTGTELRRRSRKEKRRGLVGWCSCRHSSGRFGSGASCIAEVRLFIRLRIL